MILRSIKVSGLGCFADQFEITDLADGLNIIYGPNGSGKSTLMTAVTRTLFDSHRVGGVRIMELVPWGRKLSPTVELQFEHDAQRYRIEKTFVTEPAAVLSRFEDGRFVSLARGPDADNLVREMMSATASARGAGDVQNWGIAQILFAPQHKIALPELSGNIAQRIRQSFTDQITGDAGSRLAARIAKEFEGVFTRAGKYKTGKYAPPIVGQRTQLDELITRCDVLKDLLASFDRCSRDIVDLEETVKSYQRQLETVEAERQQAAQRAELYKKLLATQEQESTKVEAAEGKYKLLESRIEQLAGARAEAALHEKQIIDLREQAKLLEVEIQQRTVVHKESAGALAAIEKRQSEITTLDRQAESAARLAEQSQRIERLARDIERIEDAVEQRDSARRRRSELVAPSAKDISAIRAAIRDRDKALLQLESAMLHVTIHPETDLSIDVLQGETQGESRAEADNDFRLSGSPTIEFTIKGVGRFEVTGPTVSVDQLRGQCEQLEASIAELTEGYGRRDLEELEQLHQKGLELDRRIDEADKLVHERLDGRAVDAIRAELSRARQVETATANRQSGETQQKLLDERLDNEQRQAAAVERRIAGLSDDGMDDETRQKKLDTMAIEHRAARAELEQATHAIGQFDDDPTELAATLQRQVDQTRKQIERAKTEQSEKRGRLRAIADSSPYGELARVEERIESLDREIEAEETRCLAIRLLHHTVQTNMREISSLVVGPIQQRSQKILRRILGSRLGALQLDDDFKPDGILPPRADQEVDVDTISGGEREQVEFAVRLALAQVLAESETTGRATMMLDDVLTMSDTARFARIVKILEEAAQKLQILIFTCHPERYGGFENPRMFDIENIRQHAIDEVDSTDD